MHKTRVAKMVQTDGFIMPTVLIISISLLITALAVIQSTTSVQASIASQYYTHVANEAAEAGVAYASYCLKLNSNTQTWGPSAQGGPKPNLTQQTDCNGTTVASLPSSVSSDTTVISTFSVGDTTVSPSGATIVSASATASRINNRSVTIAQTQASTKKIVGSPSIKYSKLTLGYYYYTPYAVEQGAFYALRSSDGTYHSAGVNKLGTLGNNTSDPFTTDPTTSSFILPTGVTGKQAYANTLSQGWNMFVITTDGDVYGTGVNNVGQLGNGSTSHHEIKPVKMNLGTEKAVSIASQGEATYVITESNKIFSFGGCDNNKLGIGTCSGNKTTMQQVPIPYDSTNPDNNIPVKIVSDAYTEFVLMKGGKVYGWGGNYQGLLADGTRNESSLPIQIGTSGNPGKPKAIQVATDGDSVYIIDDAGVAWGAGRNDHGQLGVNHNTGNVFTLTPISFPPAAGPIDEVQTDQWTAIFRTRSGQVWGAGFNRSGELGNNTTGEYTDSVVQAQLDPTKLAAHIYNSSTGDSDPRYDTTTIVTTDGLVYGMGSNAFGQLGIGNNNSAVSTPQKMQMINGTTVKAADIVSGLGTTIVLTTTGAYYSTGNNQYGQLGNGNTTDSNVPVASKLFGSSSDYLF